MLRISLFYSFQPRPKTVRPAHLSRRRSQSKLLTKTVTPLQPHNSVVAPRRRVAVSSEPNVVQTSTSTPTTSVVSRQPKFVPLLSKVADVSTANCHRRHVVGSSSNVGATIDSNRNNESTDFFGGGDHDLPMHSAKVVSINSPGAGGSQLSVQSKEVS